MLSAIPCFAAVPGAMQAGGGGSPGRVPPYCVLCVSAHAMQSVCSGPRPPTPIPPAAGCSSEGQHRLPYRPDFFHLVFLLASAYLVMIFTGWVRIFHRAGDDVHRLGRDIPQVGS